jgi:hypothetical protein
VPRKQCANHFIVASIDAPIIAPQVDQFASWHTWEDLADRRDSNIRHRLVQELDNGNAIL